MRVPGALDFFARGCAGEASGFRFDDGCEIDENQESLSRNHYHAY